MAWTEVGLERAEYPKIAQQLVEENLNWSEISDVYWSEVLHGFALLSCSVLLVFIPVVGWIAVAGMLPDWGYSEDLIRRKMQRFKAEKTWMNWLNPLHVIGYIFAILFSYNSYLRLKKACAAEGMPMV